MSFPFFLEISLLFPYSLTVARLAAAQQALTPEIIAKRTKRHLDELEVIIRMSLNS